MAIVAASTRLKADMKKVGDTMTKEWLDKAGQEDKAMLEPGLAVAPSQRHLHRQRRHAAVAAATGHGGGHAGAAAGLCRRAGAAVARPAWRRPPSIIMIVHRVSADVSIAKLFMAGVLPGLLVAGLFSGYLAV